jgi:hypothetical protein
MESDEEVTKGRLAGWDKHCSLPYTAVKQVLEIVLWLLRAYDPVT